MSSLQPREIEKAKIHCAENILRQSADAI
jgi:hypothetical protein